jgi:hypothetical protein
VLPCIGPVANLGAWTMERSRRVTWQCVVCRVGSYAHCRVWHITVKMHAQETLPCPDSVLIRTRFYYHTTPGGAFAWHGNKISEDISNTGLGIEGFGGQAGQNTRYPRNEL